LTTLLLSWYKYRTHEESTEVMGFADKIKQPGQNNKYSMRQAKATIESSTVT